MNVPIQLKIKSLYDGFSAKEQIIADYVLEHPDHIIHSSINNISSELNIASSTLFLFAKKLGYSGFRDFKMALLVQESDLRTPTIHEDILLNDDELTMTRKVFDSSIKTLNETKKLLQQSNLKAAGELLFQSSSVHFFGVGASNIVAEDAYQKFLRSPIPVHYSADYHIQLMKASLMNSTDCAVCISHTGRSQETIRLAEVAHEQHAKVIVITSHASSPLAKLGDIVLVTISEEIQFHSETLSSRISQLSILDSLYVISMFKNTKQAKENLKKIRHIIYERKQQ